MLKIFNYSHNDERIRSNTITKWSEINWGEIETYNFNLQKKIYKETKKSNAMKAKN